VEKYALFSYFITKKVENSTNYVLKKILMNNTGIFYLIWLKFWLQTKFEKEIVFESSVLAWIRNRILIRIRIKLKSWIRIRIESIRIYNPVNSYR
jgi:hypothetical protein